MISFKRTENKVQVNIEHGIFGQDDFFALYINQGIDYQAELLRNALQENLNRHLTDLKRKYYEKGWKDAKGKKKKESFFFGGWENY
jgi:hypothetical protein